MKLKDKIVVGTDLPKHLQIAWGRHIFQLCYGVRDTGLWLRDLPSSVFDLASMGFPWALKAFRQECWRKGIRPAWDNYELQNPE